MSNKTTKTGTRYIVTGAIIAALYIALTLISNVFGLAYGPIQFRVSEVLCILPIFTTAAIPGLTIGCLISNILSFNVVDMLFGTIATLLAAIFTRLSRNIKIFGIPFLSLLSPVIMNAVIVGAEIAAIYFNGTPFITMFPISALQVGIGEAAVCFLLGIPLYLALREKQIFN